MANYSSTLTTELAAGETQVLSNAALTGAFTTQAIAVGRDSAQPALLTVYNHSAVVATVQAADEDIEANYMAYKDNGTAVTVSATTVQQFSSTAKYIRLSMASDPGTAVVSIGR